MGRTARKTLNRYAAACECARRQRVASFGFVVLRVTAGEVADHDENVRHLDSDVRAFPGPSGSVLDPAVRKWKTFRNGDWSTYSIKWSGWRASHQTELERTGDDVRSEFEALKAEYTELRRRFIDEFHGATKAPEAPKQSTESGSSAPTPSSILSTAVTLVSVAIGAYVLVNLKKR